VKGIDGGPLVIINRTDPIFVSFTIPEQRLPEVRAALVSHRLGVDALVTGEELRPLRGELSFLDNAVDRGTGTIRLKATFANAEKRLWPGQFVNARLTLGTRAGAVVIPSPAVQTGRAGTFVFLIKPDLTVEARTVVVEAGSREEETVVTKGLQGGEQVVTDGQLRLVPGAKVELKPAPGAEGGEAKS
jgi:multidrug efflux system membrane fusion protein